MLPQPASDLVQSRTGKVKSDRCSGAPLSSSPSGGRKKDQQQKSKVDKKPKRPLSAYNLFFQHERDRLLRTTASPYGYSHDDNHCTLFRDPSKRADRSKKVRPPPHGKIGFAELARTIGSRWKGADKATREYFGRLAERERERYRREMEVWRNDQVRRRRRSDEDGDGEGNEGGGGAGSGGDSPPSSRSLLPLAPLAPAVTARPAQQPPNSTLNSGLPSPPHHPHRPFVYGSRSEKRHDDVGSGRTLTGLLQLQSSHVQPSSLLMSPNFPLNAALAAAPPPPPPPLVYASGNDKECHGARVRAPSRVAPSAAECDSPGGDCFYPSTSNIYTTADRSADRAHAQQPMHPPMPDTIPGPSLRQVHLLHGQPLQNQRGELEELELLPPQRRHRSWGHRSWEPETPAPTFHPHTDHGRGCKSDPGTKVPSNIGVGPSLADMYMNINNGRYNTANASWDGATTATAIPTAPFFSSDGFVGGARSEMRRHPEHMEDDGVMRMAEKQQQPLFSRLQQLPKEGGALAPAPPPASAARAGPPPPQQQPDPLSQDSGDLLDFLKEFVVD